MLLSEIPDLSAIHVIPAPGDAGTAVGAALLASGASRIPADPELIRGSAFLGVRSSTDVRSLVSDTMRIEYPSIALGSLSELLCAGELVAVVNGRSEFGPRALGNRSILARPDRPELSRYLNRTIKHREWFRPFGASILYPGGESFVPSLRWAPFMNLAFRVPEAARRSLGGVTHLDGTSRLQTVAAESPFGELLKLTGERIGVPALLNTSLNGRGDPIYANAIDAVRFASEVGLRYVFVDGVLLRNLAATVPVFS